MNIVKKSIFILILFILLTVTLGAQPLDAEWDYCWPGGDLGIPGNVSDISDAGVFSVSIQDALMISQYYVGLQKDLPFYRFPSQWMEIHVPFVEMTQESMSQMVYVDKNAALESVAAFEIDIHSSNDNEKGIVWIDEVALYRDVSTGYREYFSFGDYDELIAGGSWAGGRYYNYNNSIITTPNPTIIDCAIVVDGPTGTGNCLKTTYDIGSSLVLENYIVSLGIGIYILYSGAPEEIPLGIYNLADVRGFSGIRFWIRLQKGYYNNQGYGDEPHPAPAYMIRCRLKSADAVIGSAQYYNYYGLNIDM